MANLDSGSSNINIDGNVTSFVDFGGTDTYTILNSLSANVTITDNNASIVNLPNGLNITSALFLSDGLRITVNGFTVTFLGDPALFTYKFGGTPLDANAGTALTFDETAAAFGTTVPSDGTQSTATTTGPINEDGTVGSGGGGGTSEAALEAAYNAAKAASDAAAETAAASSSVAAQAQAAADEAEASVTDLATAQAYKLAADAAKIAANVAVADAESAVAAAAAAKTAAEATANTADDPEADAAVAVAATAAASATNAQTTANAEVVTADAAVEANTTGTAGSFEIEFDYRFDTFGFFTTGVRAALEEAANIWENIIQDEFPDFDAGQTLTVRNPETNSNVTITLDRTIDDLLIFVGSDSGTNINMGSPNSNIAADAGPDGFNPYSDINSLRVSNDFRGQGPTTDFEPYIGTARFNRDLDWSFAIDSPVAGKVDFIEVALHEIGHVLGIAASATYDTFIMGSQFFGPNALATNSDQPVPLESASNGHVQDGFLDDTVVMDTIAGGGRNLPSDIDKALLADIGYEIQGFTKQGASFALSTDQAENIFGRSIADELDGRGGDDFIAGGAGNDSISGGTGDDTIEGGDGADAFFIGFEDEQNTIIDFDVSNEKIVIDPAFGFATEQDVINTLTQPFSNVVQLVLGNGVTVSIFVNPSSSTVLSAANIDFGVLGQDQISAEGLLPALLKGPSADSEVGSVGVAIDFSGTGIHESHIGPNRTQADGGIDAGENYVIGGDETPLELYNAAGVSVDGGIELLLLPSLGEYMV